MPSPRKKKSHSNKDGENQGRSSARIHLNNKIKDEPLDSSNANSKLKKGRNVLRNNGKLATLSFQG